MYDRVLFREYKIICVVLFVKYLFLKYLIFKNKYFFEKKIYFRIYFIDILYLNYFGKGYFLYDFCLKKSVYWRKFDFIFRFKFYNFFFNFCLKFFKIWIIIEKNYFWKKKFCIGKVFFLWDYLFFYKFLLERWNRL